MVTDWILLDPFPELPVEYSEDQMLTWFKSCKSKGVASQCIVYIRCFGKQEFPCVSTYLGYAAIAVHFWST